MLRSLLHRSTTRARPRPAPAPADLHWNSAIAARLAPAKPPSQWSWVHNKFRRPQWRSLHFLIIHGSVAVNARLVHTMAGQRTPDCEEPTCGLPETVQHLFFGCNVVQAGWRFFDNYITRCFAAAPSQRPRLQFGPEHYILTDLRRFALPGTPLNMALNIGQACMLQAIWDVRNGAKFHNYPFTAELLEHTFSVLVRGHLRYLARSVPTYMSTWAPANGRGLFLQDRRTFFTDA